MKVVNIATGKKVFTLSCFFILLTTFLCAVTPQMSWASGRGHYKKERSCTKTANAALMACQNEIKDDYWIAVGNCNNLGDKTDKRKCLRGAIATWGEARPDCKEQLEARLNICAELGEGPYDPKPSPDNFIDPEQNPINYENANLYFPLTPGNTWTYRGETEDGLEEIIVTVTEEIKEIEYPADSGELFNCVVVQDVVTVDGEIVEDTFDWYAQDTDGNVWYFGEIAKNYEDGELVDVEGSWKAGQDSAKPGILMYADPLDSDFYRQEFALGNAEDMGAVKSRGETTVTVTAGHFADDVLVTRDFTPIEPDVLEFKYYAPGIGLVLEEDPDTGEQVELISTNLIP